MRYRKPLALAALLALALAAAASAALPVQLRKTAGWRSALVTDDQKPLYDSDFVAMLKAMRAGLAGGRTFNFIGTFTECFGGGFADELSDPAQAFTRYGANSASTYFEPATYNLIAGGSYYGTAWNNRADTAGPPTDEWITTNAWDAIDINNGAVVIPGVPKNPRSAVERTQYRTDRLGAGKPPEPLHNAQHNYVIIWVGEPENGDYNDVEGLFTLLTGPRYGYVANEIYILWGDGVDPNAADAWVPDDKATTAKLQWALNDIQRRINLQPANDSYQLFFWAGDHGNVDAPITIEVSDKSVGLANTGVSRQSAMGLAGATIYKASTGNNWERLIEQTAGSTELKALSFGDDFQHAFQLFNYTNASATAVVYFSVDNPSVGLPGTDVDNERNLVPPHLPGADIYAMAAGNDNRQVFDGTRNLGLSKANPPNDELNDFVLRDLDRMLDPTGLPTRPIFFTNDLNGTIWVYDPDPRFKKSYPYYTWIPDFPIGPRIVDALAMVVNLTRRDPMTNKLIFNKGQDYILFSIGRGEVAAPWTGYLPCQILGFGGGKNLFVWAGCNHLGLKNTDNVDGLDLGAGQYGQPISFDQEPSWPYPYPNGGPPGPSQP